MDSKSVYRKMKDETDKLADLRARLLIAQNEIAKAEKAHAQASYMVTTNGGEKSQKSVEAIETSKKEHEVAARRLELAMSICDQNIAEYRSEYDAAVDEETWIERVVTPMEHELKVNAPQIEARFRGTPLKAELPPLDEQLTAHKEALGHIGAELIRRKMTTFINLQRLCVDWTDYAMKPSRVRYPHEVYRDELAGSYVAMLKKRFDRILAQRSELLQNKIAVNA